MSLICKAYLHHDQWLELAKRFVCCEFEHDIVQEMYIKLDEKYTEEKALINGQINEGLCYIIIRNLCYNLNKAQSRKLKIVNLEADINNLQLQTEEYDTEIDELQNLVEDEMKNWPDYDKILFEQIYHQGVSMRQISREADISLKNIFYTMKNAKERIRRAAEKKR